MTGLEIRETLSGARYVKLHYSADPEKDAAWAERESRGVPKRDWDRQMEMREDVWDGQPVYADYSDNLHCPPKYRTEPIPTDPRIVGRCRYYGGWDCGQTLVPAFVLLQVMESGQIHAVLEVVSPGDDPMETFAPRVMRELIKVLPGQWDEVFHVGDATVAQRSGGTGETAQSVARRHGFRIVASTNQWAPRVSAVTWALTDRLDVGADGKEVARFLLDGTRCPILREGFQGAYKLEDSPRGDTVGPGRILMMPLKNGYSHVHDAAQYCMMRARRDLMDGAARIHRNNS